MRYVIAAVLVCALATAAADARAHHVPTRVWNALAECETGGNWRHRSSDYQGGLGFWEGTWDAYRLPGMPREAYNATRRQQIRVGHRVLLAFGWGAWPGCSERLGLR